MVHLMDADQIKTARITLKGSFVLIGALIIPAVGLGVVILLWLNYPALLLIIFPLGALGFLCAYLANSIQFPNSVRLGGDKLKLFYRHRAKPVLVAWTDVSKVLLFHEESNPFYKTPTCLLKFYKSGRLLSFVRFFTGEIVYKEIEKELLRRKIPFKKEEV